MKKSVVQTALVVASAAVSAFFLVASAFGPRQSNAAAAPTMTFTVTTKADDGAGSLREAITLANASPGADLINFNLGINTPTIKLFEPLHSITQAVTIDGATGGATRIELDGTLAGKSTNGLTITAGNCIIRGLVINRFSINGILISGAGGNVLQNNFIGTDAAGAMMFANGESGVRIEGSPNNTIGGTAAGSGNIISGNGSAGVTLSSTAGNHLQGNLIGTDASGAPLGNTSSGIRVLGSTTDNTIGGVLPGSGNTIAFNNGAGINLFGGAHNAVLSNAIFSNAGLGIDLSDDAGVTPNDGCDGDSGANNLQNFPDLTSASSSVGNTAIQGSLNSTASTQFRVEFFSNTVCDGSGNGEGSAFIGSTIVTTDATCLAPFNVNLPVSVPAGQFITATATDLQMVFDNTSEFSSCVPVAAAGCTISCPADLSAGTLPLPFGCGAPVSYPLPTTTGACGGVSCIPPSSSFFAVGVTLVTCKTESDASCSFNVKVEDTTAPRITCPGNISISAPPGQNSVVVRYSLPVVIDNCSSGMAVCTPPSGSAFLVGTSLVNCTASDAAGNTSTCSFSVTVSDTQAPTITCPSPVSVDVPSGQCTAVVSYPPPAVTDNAPGTIATCVPPSGSTFPLGITTVNCSAVDASGNRATCTFTVRLSGPANSGNVEIITVEFGAQTPVPPVRKAKKNPSPSCDCSKTFSISNTGCQVLAIGGSSISRTGSDVANGRITNADDTKFFALRIVNPDGSERSFPPGLCSNFCAEIAPGQSQTFRVIFNPVIPAVSGKTTGLAASEVLPNTVTSRITFTTSPPSSLTVNLIGHVSTPLQLINATQPKKAPSASFARSGNEFSLTYSVFDPNLDTTRAKYELLDRTGALVGQAIEVDLVQPIIDGKVFKGQSFTVLQRFTGARDHPEIAAVRLTVFDAESDDSLTTQLTASANAAAVRAFSADLPPNLRPRIVKLDRALP